MNSFPMWHFPLLWQTRCPSLTALFFFFFPLSLSVCACVCLCVPAGVCHVWTVPSGATGANTATCAPMTPPAVPSRRDGSTLLRLVEHTCTDTRTYNLIHLFLSRFHPSLCIFALGFFLPASCTAFQLCVSLGACLQKDSHLSSSISEVVPLIQSSCSSAIAINSLLSLELLSLTCLNNDTRSFWPHQ